MKIILGFIALVAVGAAIGGFGGSDDESTAAPVDDSPLIAEGTDYDTDADQIIELTTEGQTISNRMAERLTAAQSDPVTGCRQWPVHEADAARLHEIVIELEGLGASTPEMKQADETLSQSISNVAQLCAEAGL